MTRQYASTSLDTSTGKYSSTKNNYYPAVLTDAHAPKLQVKALSVLVLVQQTKEKRTSKFGEAVGRATGYEERVLPARQQHDTVVILAAAAVAGCTPVLSAAPGHRRVRKAPASVSKVFVTFKHRGSKLGGQQAMAVNSNK